MNNPTESDFILFIHQAQASFGEEYEFGSYELALEVAKKLDIQNPDKFAQTAATLICDDLYLEQVFDMAYKITKIWETA